MRELSKAPYELGCFLRDFVSSEFTEEKRRIIRKWACRKEVPREYYAALSQGGGVPGCYLSFVLCLLCLRPPPKSNSNKYKPKWHRSQCCGQKWKCACVAQTKQVRNDSGTRTNTNPNDTEANAAGRSGNARALRASQNRKEDSV